MGDSQESILVSIDDTNLALADPADDVRGRKMVDRNGDEVGDVEGLLIDPSERRVRFLAIGSGGILGISERKQLVPVDAVTGVDGETVRIDNDRADVAGAPAYDPQVTERPYFQDLYSYYGYGPFWGPATCIRGSRSAESIQLASAWKERQPLPCSAQ